MLNEHWGENVSNASEISLLSNSLPRRYEIFAHYTGGRNVQRRLLPRLKETDKNKGCCVYCMISSSAAYSKINYVLMEVGRYPCKPTPLKN